EAASVFRGERVSLGSRPGVRKVRTAYNRNQGQNSGAGAIALAAAWGARRIILLGYDCQYAAGKRHWHGDHPKGTAGNASPQSVAKWPAQFRDLLPHVRGIEIINATRQTALTVFARATLEDALCERDQSRHRQAPTAGDSQRRRRGSSAGAGQRGSGGV